MKIGSLLLVLVIVIVLSLISTGCHHTIERQVIRQEMPAREKNIEIVMSATLRDGSGVEFDHNGATYQWLTVASEHELCVSGITRKGELRTIPISDIVEARVKAREFDGVGSALGIITISTTLVVVVAIGIFVTAFRVH